MRITALVKSSDHVCCRYRLAAYRQIWEQKGHQLSLRPWPKTWLSRWRLRRELGRADLVILQRKLVPAWQLALLRRSTDVLLFDFDDAVFLRDSYAPQGCYSSARARGFAAVIRACDAVIAGNDFLRVSTRIGTPWPTTFGQEVASNSFGSARRAPYGAWKEFDRSWRA